MNHKTGRGYIKKEQKPVKVFTLDTETRGMNGEIFKVGLFDGDEYTAKDTFQPIKQKLLNASITQDVHIFVHNLNFDLGKIIKDLALEILFLPSIIINGRATIIKTKDVTFHDSYSILPYSLDTLCKDFDIKNRKMDLVKALDTPEYRKYLVYMEPIKRTIYQQKYDKVFHLVRKQPNKVDKKATLKKFFTEVPPEDPLLNEYLEFDCRSLYEIINVTIKNSGLPSDDFMVSPTTASMSLKVYSTKFVKDYKKAIRTSYEGRNLVIEKDLRESYYGGRTEVFIPKLKNGFHYDVNSLYPYVMGKAGLLFPVGDYEERTGTKALIQWQLFLRNGFGGGTIRAKVKIPNDMQYPILPYREFQKLMFPTGTIEGTWTFHELKFACDRGVEVQEVSKTIFFKEMVDLFSKFVTYFEKLKNDNTSTVIDGKKTGLNENGEKVNPSLRSFAKLILNALYGKFATERERTSYTSLKEIEETIERLEKKAEIFTPEIEFFQNLKKMRFRFPGEPGKMMDQAQKEWTQNNDVSLIGRMPYRYANHTLGEELIKYTTYITGEYVQVQISSYVTAYARMVLYEGIENIVSRGGKVYYCDTDSLVSDIELEPHLIHNSEFGKWQLEGKIKKAYFSQPKVYVEETIKGKRTSYKIDLYRNEKKITIQTSNDKIEVNKKFKGLPGAKVQTMTVSDYAYINMRQELKDVDRVELLTKEEGFENIIKPLTAIVQNQDFNKMVKIEKSLLIRGLMEKRKMDYKNNTSTPWSFDQGTQNELKQYFDKVQEENKQFVETWTKQIDIMLKEEGFIQIPKKGTYLYKKYLEIEPKTRRKYFRQKGLHIDYFADKVEYTPEDLLLEFSLEM